LGGLVQLRLSVGQISGVSSDIVSEERLGLRALLRVFGILSVIGSLGVFQLTLDFVHEAGDLAQRSIGIHIHVHLHHLNDAS
jgi:hypothetical protein